MKQYIFLHGEFNNFPISNNKNIVSGVTILTLISTKVYPLLLMYDIHLQIYNPSHRTLSFLFWLHSTLQALCHSSDRARWFQKWKQYNLWVEFENNFLNLCSADCFKSKSRVRIFTPEFIPSCVPSSLFLSKPSPNTEKYWKSMKLLHILSVKLEHCSTKIILAYCFV